MSSFELFELFKYHSS